MGLKMVVDSDMDNKMPAYNSRLTGKNRGWGNSIRYMCILGAILAVVKGLESSVHLLSPDFPSLKLIEDSFINGAASVRPLHSLEVDPEQLTSRKGVEDNRAGLLMSAPDSAEELQEIELGLPEYNQAGLFLSATDSHEGQRERIGVGVSDDREEEGEAMSATDSYEGPGQRLEIGVSEGREEKSYEGLPMIEPGVPKDNQAGKDSYQIPGQKIELGFSEGRKQEGEAKSLNMEAQSHGLERIQAMSSATNSSNASAASGQFNITVGKWVTDDAGPLYRFNECRILSQPQNCQQNGRPDNGYEFYRWQPRECSIPRFNPQAFLEFMRGKTLAFVGDSLARNQMESLMCMLLQVADAKSRGNKQMQKWYFASHEFTIIRMWSSWLVRSKGDFPPSSSAAPPEATKLNLTELDDYAFHLPKFDVTILSSGHWWLRKTAFFMDGELQGGFGWPWLPSLGTQKMDHVRAFGTAISTALRIAGTHPGYKGLTILRTYAPDHYSGGNWDSGGSCTGRTAPFDRAPEHGFNQRMHEQQIMAFRESTKQGETMPNGSRLRLLDVYPILNYRGDGHPGPYRSMDPLKRTTRDAKGRPPPQDCLHWCMPGPLDSMNELLFEILKTGLT